MKAYRYYSTQRPLGPGCCPRQGIVAVHNFDCDARVYCPEIDRAAWAYADYSRPLSDTEVCDYELTYYGRVVAEVAV